MYVALAIRVGDRMIDGPLHKLAGTRESDGAYATACGLMLPGGVKTEGARLYEPSHITHSLEPVCGDCFPTLQAQEVSA